MEKLDIKTAGNPILHEKGSKIEVFDADLKTLSASMLEKMYELNGIGLAAQQVGIARQIAVIDWPCENEEKVVCDSKTLPLGLIFPLVVINPVVTPQGKEKNVSEEGCLSIPGKTAKVERFSKIKLNYFDLDGINHTIECEGLLSICVQHEVDHLNGILMTDRAIDKKK